jgi:hypothetical protein
LRVSIHSQTPVNLCLLTWLPTFPLEDKESRECNTYHEYSNIIHIQPQSATKQKLKRRPQNTPSHRVKKKCYREDPSCKNSKKKREKRDYILMFAGGVRRRETTTEATVVKMGAREQSGGEAHEEGDAPKKERRVYEGCAF